MSPLSLLATSTQRIICHDDQRLNNGPLRELVLSTDENGTYFAQSSFITSLNAPEIRVEKWVSNLTCKIDERTPVAFCTDPTNQSKLEIRELREAFFDDLDDTTKKKTLRSFAISLIENGNETKSLSFAAADCVSLDSGE